LASQHLLARPGRRALSVPAVPFLHDWDPPSVCRSHHHGHRRLQHLSPRCGSMLHPVRNVRSSAPTGPSSL